jgi:hypothetical protein
MKRQLAVQLIICVALVASASAQRPTQDHSDVERKPPPFETLPGLPLGNANCFPLRAPSLTVSLAVYELVPGPNFGDDPIRRPKAELETALRNAIKGLPVMDGRNGRAIARSPDRRCDVSPHGFGWEALWGRPHRLERSRPWAGADILHRLSGDPDRGLCRRDGGDRRPDAAWPSECAEASLTRGEPRSFGSRARSGVPYRP